MVPWDGCKAYQIAFAPRTKDCVGCSTPAIQGFFDVVKKQNGM